jgi:RNA polymerase sigma-70 factor (ECF subfamily)
LTAKTSFSETVELLAAARAGDKTALEKVVLRHQDQVLSRIRLMMGPEARRRAESMDFLQDAFANLVASLHRIHVENENSLVCFVLAVARNRIRDSVRKRREHAFESFSRSLDGQMAKTRTPFDEVAGSERLQHVAEAIESLREDHRQVIELRNLEGCSFSEIGKRMARTEAAAFTLHARALVSLGEMLRAQGAVKE